MAGNKVKRVALGLDVGGTRIKAVALETPFRIVGEHDLPSPAMEGPEAVRKAIEGAISHFHDQGIDIEAIGIGIAGSVDGKLGIVRNCPNFANWKNVPLKSLVESAFRVPVVVDNDANCAVYGEWQTGDAQRFSNVLLLTLGTGIGGGLILDGHLFRGATGTAGELGHMSIHSDGEWCPCGNRGCFERYCSASALARRAGCTSKELFERKNEEKCRTILAEFIRDFQSGLTSLANIFDPDLILLGGAMAEGVLEFLPEIEAWMRAHAFPAVAEKVKVALTKHGNRSGSIGAALLSLAQ